MAVLAGTRRSALNFLLYQAGWWACVLGAARGQPLWGPAVTALALAAHFAWVSDRRAREALFVAAAGTVGMAVELVFMATGVYRLAPPIPGVIVLALWAAALWAMFAATLDAMLRWLQGRYQLAAILGAAGGPLAFLAGQSLGAVIIHPHWTRGLLPLAAAWAVLMPSMLRLGREMGAWRRHP